MSDYKRLWLVKLRDKCTSYRIAYPRISVLWLSGTHWEKRLIKDNRSINSLNTVCREHDIVYLHNKDLIKRHVVDNILAAKARKCIMRDSTFGERVIAIVIWVAMKAKTKISISLKMKKKKATSKRVFPVMMVSSLYLYRC